MAGESNQDAAGNILGYTAGRCGWEGGGLSLPVKDSAPKTRTRDYFLCFGVFVIFFANKLFYICCKTSVNVQSFSNKLARPVLCFSLLYCPISDRYVQITVSLKETFSFYRCFCCNLFHIQLNMIGANGKHIFRGEKHTLR